MIFVTQDIKQDPRKRWALPDEVFFAAGACHILAFAFLERFPNKNFSPFWIKPLDGHRGNHIFVTDKNVVFDYEGFTPFNQFIEKTEKQMRTMFYDWKYELVSLPKKCTRFRGSIKDLRWTLAKRARSVSSQCSPEG